MQRHRDRDRAHRHRSVEPRLRPAAGFGIRWYSPLGPIRVELGFNLNKKTGERGSVFDFSMGKPF
ncbi:MAG: BamA/TamA family outer membrane protein [Polyangiales bacterium]